MLGLRLCITPFPFDFPLKKALLTILTIITLDQILKIWVKLNFHYGESRTIIAGWLDLQFVENPGMAFGWMIPGEAGKLTLSIFRLIVVSGITWYLYRLIKEKAHWGYVVCVSMIVAGALGNIIDSLAYGGMFDRGSMYDPDFNDYTMYFGKAELNYEGYAKPLMGNVVDMFHFTARWPWGEPHERSEIFPPIFNVADAAITVGIVLIMLFQRKFFPKKEDAESTSEEIADAVAPESAIES
jgi:signal peptidase II